MCKSQLGFTDLPSPGALWNFFTQNMWARWPPELDRAKRPPDPGSSWFRRDGFDGFVPKGHVKTSAKRVGWGDVRKTAAAWHAAGVSSACDPTDAGEQEGHLCTECEQLYRGNVRHVSGLCKFSDMRAMFVGFLTPTKETPGGGAKSERRLQPVPLVAALKCGRGSFVSLFGCRAAQKCTRQRLALSPGLLCRAAIAAFQRCCLGLRWGNPIEGTSWEALRILLSTPMECGGFDLCSSGFW